MWSDKPDAGALEAALAALRSVLPPGATATSNRTRLSGNASPEQVAQLCQTEPGFIWLDGDRTRHLLFRNPLAVLSSDGSHITASGPRGANVWPGKSLDGLDAALRAWSATGGLLAGWIGYEVGSELEGTGTVRPDAALPRLHFGLYDSVLIHDAGGWTWQGTNASREPAASQDLLHRAEATPLPPLTHEPLSPGTPLDGHDAFTASVANLVRRIHAGDLFQTNLCRQLQLPFQPSDAWQLYRRMRALNPATSGAFLQLGEGRAILSGSPELFLRVNDRVKDGIVESCPIKGTRPRGATAAADRQLSQELLESEKDRAELAMVVDVTRNDLSRVCIPGTVEVAAHAVLMTLPTLHHTCSTIIGKLRQDTTAADVLKATFPPASITGAPKIAAMEAAYLEEGVVRGPCMGAIGWISTDGDMELSVAIRTAYAAAGQLTYFAGCGITAESDPAAEFAESQTKAVAFLSALGIAEQPCGHRIAKSPPDGAHTLQSQTEL